MTIQLPAEFHATIREKIASGRYRDETEVIRAALDALNERDHDKLERLRANLAVGLAEIERGEGRLWTPELMDELERNAEEMYRRGEQPDPDVCP